MFRAGGHTRNKVRREHSTVSDPVPAMKARTWVRVSRVRARARARARIRIRVRIRVRVHTRHSHRGHRHSRHDRR